ncbi:MAG: helix-turn-helix transcriptional regulator [Bacteroidetes bacterium]|nr:helix-turn-helix transcriptional regulator [Bacteroidota bacterium]
MQSENIGGYIRQLREKENMPLRKLAALLEIDQSTLSKLERGERPVSRPMIPIIAKTFGLNEKDLVVRYMGKLLAYQIADEQCVEEILKAAEEEVIYIRKQNKK